MSRLCYDGIHWTEKVLIFRWSQMMHGPLATWHGRNFGGSSAYALLGPDIANPGGESHSPPSATGPGWDSPWPHSAHGGPGLCFTEDGANTWVRGHLINGNWGGSGSSWSNLTPLTSQANSNHKTVENRIKVLLQNFRAFDNMGNGHQPYWYGIRYWVQVATDPWASPAPMGELYSYCPNMIRVTWRVVRINKPVGLPGTSSAAHIGAVSAAGIGSLAATPATQVQINTDLPNVATLNALPQALVANPDNIGEVGGGAYAIPVGAPAITPASSHLDGSVEIFQN